MLNKNLLWSPVEDMVGNPVAQELYELTVWLANLEDTSVHGVASGLTKTYMVVDICSTTVTHITLRQ